MSPRQTCHHNDLPLARVSKTCHHIAPTLLHGSKTCRYNALPWFRCVLGGHARTQGRSSEHLAGGGCEWATDKTRLTGHLCHNRDCQHHAHAGCEFDTSHNYNTHDTTVSTTVITNMTEQRRGGDCRPVPRSTLRSRPARAGHRATLRAVTFRRFLAATNSPTTSHRYYCVETVTFTYRRTP